MFSEESFTIDLVRAPGFAAILIAVHAIAAASPALAGLPSWAALPVGFVVLVQGVRLAWRDGLRQGPYAVVRVEVHVDGRIRLWFGNGREVSCSRGADTWITSRFVMLDLRGAGWRAPRGLLVRAADLEGYRRLAVLLRWGREGSRDGRSGTPEVLGSP